MVFKIFLFVLFIIFLELLLRLIKYRRSGNWELFALHLDRKKQYLSSFEPHTYLGFTKSKNVRNKRFITNNAGFVGSKDVNLAPSEDLDTVRIIVCGCSTVEQNDLDMEPEFDRELTWPKVMEKNLNKKAQVENYEVINAGCSGYTILESTIHLLTKCVPFKPNYAILYQGINDAWHIQPAPDFVPDYTHARQPPVFPKSNGLLSFMPNVRISFVYQYFLLYLSKLFEKPPGLLNYISRNYSFNMTFDQISAAAKTYEDYLRSFCHISIGHNITPILIPWIYSPEMVEKPTNIKNWDKKKFIELLEMNNESIRQVAKEIDGAILLELTDYDKDNFRKNDWIHFSKRGLNKIGSDAAIEFLKIRKTNNI